MLHFASLIDGKVYWVKSETLYEDSKGKLWAEDLFTETKGERHVVGDHDVAVCKRGTKLHIVYIPEMVKVDAGEIPEWALRNHGPGGVNVYMTTKIPFADQLSNAHRTVRAKQLTEGQTGWLFTWQLLSVAQDEWRISADASVELEHSSNHGLLVTRDKDGSVIVDRSTFYEEKNYPKLDTTYLVSCTTKLLRAVIVDTVHEKQSKRKLANEDDESLQCPRKMVEVRLVECNIAHKHHQLNASKVTMRLSREQCATLLRNKDWNVNNENPVAVNICGVTIPRSWSIKPEDRHTQSEREADAKQQEEIYMTGGDSAFAKLASWIGLGQSSVAQSRYSPCSHVPAVLPLSPVSECSVCLSAPAEGVFVPCGHKVCCMSCGPSQSLCPICRILSTQFMKIFE